MKKKYYVKQYTDYKFPKCKRCGKNSYPDKATAIKVKEIRENEDWGIRLKIYKCPYSDAYHLTSDLPFL